MKENSMREILPDRLHAVDLEYDLKKLHAEMEYHKAKVIIFDQAIKVQQKELDRMFDASEDQISKGEMYQWIWLIEISITYLGKITTSNTTSKWQWRNISKKRRKRNEVNKNTSKVSCKVIPTRRFEKNRNSTTVSSRNG